MALPQSDPGRGFPLAAAISRNRSVLYVTAYDGRALLVIAPGDHAGHPARKPAAKPEGVAVGGDERVLISTVGTGAGNPQNVLPIYDPFSPQAVVLRARNA